MVIMGTVHDLKHANLAVKHNPGSVMSWARMAVSVSDTLALVSDSTANGSNKVNAKVYRSFCVLSFSQMHHNSQDDIPSFRRTIILSNQRAFRGKEVDLTD